MLSHSTYKQGFRGNVTRCDLMRYFSHLSRYTSLINTRRVRWVQLLHNSAAFAASFDSPLTMRKLQLFRWKLGGDDQLSLTPREEHSVCLLSHAAVTTTQSPGAHSFLDNVQSWHSAVSDMPGSVKSERRPSKSKFSSLSFKGLRKAEATSDKRSVINQGSRHDDVNSF